MSQRAMTECNIDSKPWEALAGIRNLWKQQVLQRQKRGVDAIHDKDDEKGPEEKPVISRTTQLHNRNLSSYARAAVEIAMMLINMNLSRQYSMVDMNGQRMPLSSTTGICLRMPGLQRR